ncbi:YdcF family protein [Shewanella gaetbuli]
MFWVKKLVSQLFMPIPLTILLLLLSVVLLTWFRTRFSALAKICFTSACAVLILLSQSSVSYFLANSLESQYPVNYSVIQQPCTVMVLGSGHSDKQGLTATQQLSTTALARLTEGVRQLSLGQHCQLVVSGWSGGYMQTDHATVMKAAAIELGVSPQQIITFPHAKDTIEEAMYLYREIGQQPFRLVTSATHMPRAMLIFESLGMAPHAAPTDFNAKKGLWWRLDADYLLTSQKSIHEYVGRLWITLKGISADQMVNQLPMTEELDID